MKKKIIAFLGLIMIVLLFVACGDKSVKEEPEIDVPSISEEEKLDEEQVVVTVNGDEVKGVTYNLVYAQLKLHAMQTNQDYTDEEIKELTIESLIDRQVLMQQAKKNGIIVTDEDASNELERLKSENEEAFQTLLEQYQITESSFHHQLIFEMTMNEFLLEEIEVTVTDEEVEQVYEEAKAENDDIPELVEIRDTLKRRIEAQKTNEALQARIDEVKEQSDIELHL